MVLVGSLYSQFSLVSGGSSSSKSEMDFPVFLDLLSLFLVFSSDSLDCSFSSEIRSRRRVASTPGLTPKQKGVIFTLFAFRTTRF